MTGAAFAESAAECSVPSDHDVVLEGGLRQARVRLKTDLRPEALEGVYRKLTHASTIGRQGIALAVST